MNTVFKTGEFTDYRGDKHHFTVAGVVLSYADDDMRLEHALSAEIAFDDEGQIIYDDNDKPLFIEESEDYAPIYKVISIGISICNPLDDYNSKRGKCQAEGRAIKYHDRVIALSKGGMCTEDTIQYFVNMTADNLEKNPGLFIKGYNEAARKYNK